MGHIIRRVLNAEYNRELLDDKDYCGNKRLELAGQVDMNTVFNSYCYKTK
jgi:DNA-directed RNA polymerase beta subunit